MSQQTATATAARFAATPVTLLIRSKRMLTAEICELELQDPAGRELPAFEAGAHINVMTPSGAVRSYSLTNDPIETQHYVIAVKREEQGRGGSLSMVRDTREGRLLNASAPSNAFALVDAAKYLLIAGGIGITPILCMARVLLRRGHDDFRVIYCTRSAQMTAYLAQVSVELAGRITVHHDQGLAQRGFDFWPWFLKPDDTYIYCCGPSGLMEHVRTCTIHWPPRAIHFEDFAGVAAVAPGSSPFRVKRAASGEMFDVPAERTILEVLRTHGFDLPSSCESGTCGTCRTRLVSGEAEHRDAVLDEAERRQFIMPCVSRAAGQEIELDF